MSEVNLSKRGDPRQLVELAVSCGRKFQSEQTGFVHFYHSKEDEKDNATIPVYENLLFVLALMRSKNADTVQEGKAIIEKLLHFQNVSMEACRGGFPVYLHEYPYCKDRLHGIRLLPVFYSILFNFHHVIGASLKEAIIHSSRQILEQSLQTLEEKPAPYSLVLTLGIILQAFGKFLDDKAYVEKGKELVAGLKDPSQDACWYCKKSLSEILIALQFAKNTSLPAGWDGFWQFLSNTWHAPSFAYIGPGWKDFQDGEEAQSTLYDLFMGFATGHYGYRAFEDNPYHLQGALIYTAADLLPPPKKQFQGALGESSWLVVQNDHYGLSLMKKKSKESVPERGFNPLKLIWGDKTRMHSFVSQGGNIEAIDFQWHPDGLISMEVLLAELPNLEDKEKAREVLFFTEALEGVHIQASHAKATTFMLGDEIKVSSYGMSLSLNFTLLEGDGKFMGHIMRGNRPSQIGAKGEARLKAYDWQIFLRTITRTTPCRLKVEIQIDKAEL